ncbi:MAG: HEAT repeat domain-containing protein [Planctomycetes bacterium]|nr:HEAT repeat domain-containing protein [Planctomycetota bacterium]
MLRLLAAFLCFLGTWPSALLAQSEAKDLSRFEKLFQPSPKGAPSLEDRRAAIAAIASYDSKAAAQTLVEAYQVVTEEIETALSQRAQDEAEFKKLEIELDLANQQPPFKKGMPPKYPRYLELQSQLAKIPTAPLELEGLREALRERLSALRAPAALDWLLAKVIGDEDQPFTLKLSIARAALKIGPPLVPAMLAALQKAKRPEEILVLIDSLGNIGKPAQAATPAIVKLLDHGDSGVRERAAWALSQIAAPEGIGPLVARLEKEEDRTQRKLCIALEVLTRQRLGQSASAWKRWWSVEGTKYASGAVELGGGESSSTSARSTSGYYHGIPQEGGALVYVIDCSGSMIISFKDPQYDEIGQPVPPKDPRESRIEACKAELSKAIGELAEGTKFNIVAFNYTVWRYQEQMSVASAPSVKAAQEWIAKLDAKTVTNIHDALGMAFGCGGRGVRDRYYTAEIDTIFLLTDGSPTKPDSSPDSTEKILQAAREWNPFRRVTIHCIGIGSGLNAPFLQQLATEHGGKFVQR